MMNIRLSDNDRYHAMNILSEHFANNRIDEIEFNARTSLIQKSIKVNDLVPVFQDLPGGIPININQIGQLEHVGNNQIIQEDNTINLEKMKKSYNMEGIVIGITLILFMTFLLTGFHFAWIIWLNLFITIPLTRKLFGVTDGEMKAFKKIRKHDNKQDYNKVISNYK